MAKLNIELVADATNAQVGLNKVTESTSSLLNQLIKTNEGAVKFGQALNRDLAVAADKAGTGVKGLQAQLKVLMQYQERVRQGLGETSGEYTAFKDAIALLNTEIQNQTVAETQNISVTKTLSIENEKLAKSYKSVDTASGGALKKLTSIAGNILKFQLLMGPITAGIRGIRNAISESAKYAAEAEQVYNKLATVFDLVAKSADSAAQSIANSLGVAKSTAAGALSTVGDLLQAQGMGTAESLTKATTWVSQFQDIIAFKDLNTTLDDFAQNFMSGAAGNLRNFRSFGSIVKESAVNAELAAQGLDKLTGSQLELAKMTTRAEIALKQQANAMGATEREWDTMLSVNRRLNEAQKEFRELLGNSINTALKPFKSWWTEILEETNKALATQQQFLAGAKELSNYDINNNAKDYNTFKGTVESVYQNATQREVEGVYPDFKNVTEILDSDTAVQLLLDELKTELIAFTATTEQIRKILGDNLSDAIYDALAAEERRIAEENRIEKEISARSVKIQSLADKYSNFSESLLGITGVNFNASDFSTAAKAYSGSDKDTEFAANMIAKTIMRNVTASLQSISTADLASTWGDVIAGALDELDEGQLRQAQLDSLRSLFETTWNEFAEGGFTDDELGKLREIKTEYGRLSEELDKYNRRLKNQEDFISALNNLSGTADSYDVQYAQVGMNANQKEMDNLKRSKNAAKALLDPESEKYAENLAALDAEFERAERSLLDLQNAQERYNKQLEAEAYEKERIAEYEEAVKSINESLADYANQIGQIGMTDEQKALDDLRIAHEKQIAALDITQEEEEKLTALYERQRSALEDLQKKQKEYNDRITAQASAYSLVGGAKQSFLDRAITKDYMSRGIRVQGTTFSNPNENQARVFLEYNKSIQKLNEDLALLDTYVNDAGETVYDFGGGIGYTAKEIEDILEGELLVSLKDLADSAKEASVTWEDIYKDANPFASEVNTFNMGKEASGGGIGGGIWALLLELLKNTEVFKTLVDLFKDTFVPILDAILKPLMPVLKMFAAFFDNLDWEMAFEIIKIIAQVLAGTLFVIKAAINTIEAVVKTIYYAITFQWGKIGDLWRDFVDTTKEDYAKMEECLGEIQNSTFEIARNTDEEDKDLALLRDLYNRGIIDESTYYKESGSLQGNYLPSPVVPSYPTSRSINTGNIIFNISGTNPKEAAREVAMELKRLGMANIDTDSFAFAVGGY